MTQTWAELWNDPEAGKPCALAGAVQGAPADQGLASGRLSLGNRAGPEHRAEDARGQEEGRPTGASLCAPFSASFLGRSRLAREAAVRRPDLPGQSPAAGGPRQAARVGLGICICKRFLGDADSMGPECSVENFCSR